jgi:hypothetical protein
VRGEQRGCCCDQHDGGEQAEAGEQAAMAELPHVRGAFSLVFMDDDALYEQYDEASVYEEGDENTQAYTVSIEERQQQHADNMVVQAMPADIQQTKFRLDTGCVGGNVVKDEALLRDVDAANVSVTGVAGPADQTSLKGTLPAAGTSYVLTKARDNLIAVKNLTKQGLTFEGDNSKMVFRDGSGAIMLTTRDDGDG